MRVLLPLLLLASCDSPQPKGPPPSPLQIEMTGVIRTTGHAPVGGEMAFVLLEVDFVNRGAHSIRVEKMEYTVFAKDHPVGENITDAVFTVKPGRRELTLEVTRGMLKSRKSVDEVFDRIQAAGSSVRISGWMELTIDEKRGKYAFSAKGLTP